MANLSKKMQERLDKWREKQKPVENPVALIRQEKSMQEKMLLEIDYRKRPRR